MSVWHDAYPRTGAGGERGDRGGRGEQRKGRIGGLYIPSTVLYFTLYCTNTYEVTSPELLVRTSCTYVQYT